MNEDIKRAVIRFMRVIVPQIPTFLALIAPLPPAVVAVCVFGGAVLTALDKLFRSLGWY